VTQNKRIGIIVGIEQEAKLLRPLLARLDDDVRPLLRCADMDVDKASKLAEELVLQGVSGLISLGVAGGLDPVLKPGDLILPHEISNVDGEAIPCDAPWLQALSAKTKPHANGRLLSSPVPVTSVADKARLHKNYDANAVDMESFSIAKMAQSAALPFIAIRVIVDGADMAIPESALAGTPFAVMKKAVKQPGDFPALLRLGSHMKKATKTLSCVARLGLPFFGL
jgi:hypothetical protein